MEKEKEGNPSQPFFSSSISIIPKWYRKRRVMKLILSNLSKKLDAR